MLSKTLCILAAAAASAAVGQVTDAYGPSSPTAKYDIAPDGGIVYNPLSREARLTGQLDKYEGRPRQTANVKLDPYEASFVVPKTASAYDVVPVGYTVRGCPEGKVLAVGVTAFEEPNRRQNHNMADMNLPVGMEVELQYVGSVTAHNDPLRRQLIKPDLSDGPRPYPEFIPKPMVRSGVVEAGDFVWFRLQFTNTGQTILDPEGLSGLIIVPELHKKTDDGTFVRVAGTINRHERILDYMYPGETQEFWAHFYYPNNGTPHGFGLEPGEYKIVVQFCTRCHYHYHRFWNMWKGPVFAEFEVPVVVAKEPVEAPVVVHRRNAEHDLPDLIPRYIHSFEEFMAGFDVHLAPKSETNGTLYCQVAPWTTQLVLKIVDAEGGRLMTQAIPIRVSEAGLRIKYDPDHPMTVTRAGRKFPAITAQAMPGMRWNIHFGPDPAATLRRYFDDMRSCGINLMVTTAGNWMYSDFDGDSHPLGDAFMYFLDLCREGGMPVQGWAVYPLNRMQYLKYAGQILGKELDATEIEHRPGYCNKADPDLPIAVAALTKYNLARWGDIWYQLPDGRVPVDIEDSWGWMRDDLDIRYPEGSHMVSWFRQYLKGKYEFIHRLNEAWGTSFASFDDIDPEAGQTENQFGHKWEYINRALAFCDWSLPVDEWDRFRTQARVEIYEKTMALVRRSIPGAAFCLRTEGGNIPLSDLSAQDKNSHERHLFYSQRRCAIMGEYIGPSDSIIMHSDYVTMPYPPSRLRSYIARCVRMGLIPAHLPQFDHMRDIAVNDSWGGDYEINYNLPGPQHAVMMHTLTAVYPWWRATYEEGGTPGILWGDYACDGFATETQKREMKLFVQELEEEMRRHPNAFDPDPKPDDSWRPKQGKIGFITTR